MLSINYIMCTETVRGHHYASLVLDCNYRGTRDRGVQRPRRRLHALEQVVRAALPPSFRVMIHLFYFLLIFHPNNNYDSYK